MKGSLVRLPYVKIKSINHELKEESKKSTDFATGLTIPLPPKKNKKIITFKHAHSYKFMSSFGSKIKYIFVLLFQNAIFVLELVF